MKVNRKLVTRDYISFVLSRWEACFAFEPTFAATVFACGTGQLSLQCCFAGGLKILAFDGCRVEILVKNDTKVQL